jgi:hypothetical protein
MSHWTRALVGASKGTCTLGGIFGTMTANAFLGAGP